MRLVKMRVRNFRCFKGETTITFDDITAFIGKNDVGKSTIFDALDIFLNDNMPDKDDASKNGDSKDLTIICEFDGLPDKVVIDQDYATTLKEEYLVNENGFLEIHKTYNGSLEKPKCVGVSAYANHPTGENIKDLLSLKNKDLKQRAKDLNVELSGIDQKINAQLRSKIREHIGDLNLEPRSIPLNEDNAKDVWVGLKKYMPVFALFKSDRTSTDQDAEAQDPLMAAVKEAIKKKEEDLNKIASYIEDEVKKIANNTLNKIKEMDPSLASQLNPRFKPQKWDSLFKASITGEDDIPINKRGSGVRRLILLNFFRAKSEQQALESGHNTVIYGIEEPETSQHPNNQRLLLRALTELSEDSQVIISTHTPMLARGLPDENIRYINRKEDDVREILVGGESANEMFTKALGILPDNNVKLFIGVEGKHDISFLQNMAKMLIRERIAVPDLEKLEVDGEIIFFPCGGTNLALWTSRLKDLNRPEFHLADRDTIPPADAKYNKHIADVNARGGQNIGKNTNKLEMENYIHKDAIVEAYQENDIQITIDDHYGPVDDVPEKVAQLVHNASDSDKAWEDVDIEERRKKASKVKRMLNTVAISKMNLARLKELDPDDELLGWYEDMKNLMQE